MSKANKDFDLDLKFGQQGEQWLTLLADEQQIEVKRERDQWATTGNICFEIRYKGEPSGIAATKAQWWAHILYLKGENKAIFLFLVSDLRAKLRELVKTKQLRMVNGGDGDHSALILCPLEKIHLLVGREKS